MTQNNLIVFAKVECGKCKGAKLIFTDRWQIFANNLRDAIETQARCYNKDAVQKTMNGAMEHLKLCENKPLAPCADCKGKGYLLQEMELTAEIIAENFGYAEMSKLIGIVEEKQKEKD